jgi:C4-dicarboxylate-specific signal transduction histidine kinase
MLGHQQVTDIATAISELFKNAHDAYAKEVAIDYLRDEDLLVIHDDGLGMSPEQFQDRWLTLAADNAAERADPPKPPKGMKKRPIQGEKGIGRLAIATIGPQALVLTRPRGAKEKLTVALINWRLFEIPGINLADVKIPLRVFPSGRHPSETDLKKLVAQASKSLKELKIPASDSTEVQRHLRQFSRDLDPAGLLDALSKSSVTAGGHGTVFIISPTADELVDDLNEIAAEANPPPGLLKTLIGFSNTMVPESEKPRIKTVFRDHRGVDDTEDVISKNEFFTPAEFGEADHSFRGEFDHHGSFHGAISIFGGKPRKYPWTWKKAKGRDLGCGPFRLSVAYVQGEEKESRLDGTRYKQLVGKLERIGGLYVYRDGIRVLPYGDPAFDFLQFEKRRSLKASRYYFSYRRMFGAIELRSDANAGLEEKAGREGFRGNRAYRDFTGLLEDFFSDLAAEFFVREGAQAEEFEVGRKREKDRHERLRERKLEAQRKQEAFEQMLRERLSAVDAEEPSSQAEELLERLQADIAALQGSKKTREKRLNKLEAAAFEELDDLRALYKVTPPAGVGLPPALRKEWEALADAGEAIEYEVWSPTAQQVSKVVSETRKDVGLETDRRGRLVELVDAAANRREGEAHERSVAAKSSLETFDSDAEQAIGKLVAGVAEAAGAARTAAGNGGGPVRSERDLNLRRERIEAQLAVDTRDQLVQLESLSELLSDGLNALGTLEGSKPALTAVLEEELLDLQERSQQDLELAQIGMATQVISHELSATVTSVRTGLRRLSAWSEQNEGLRKVYEDLRASFDHLDAYLSLFTPLQRRLRRRRERLNGRGVEKFVKELFSRRLEADEIELRSTKKFKEWTASGFRSDLYPAFVNLIDNAIFWVADTKAPRWIKLDADGSDLVVSDSGPGIPVADRNAIWEFGFTRKPRGRGAGLHIAREVLQREGWSIELEKAKKGTGASFRISPAK